MTDVFNNAENVCLYDEQGNRLATSTHPLIVQQKRVEPSTVTQVAASTTSVTIAAANPNRHGFTVFNNTSLNAMRVKLGPNAAANSFSVSIPSGGYWEMPLGYSGEVTAIWNAATGNALVTEY